MVEREMNVGATNVRAKTHTFLLLLLSCFLLQFIWSPPVHARALPQEAQASQDDAAQPAQKSLGSLNSTGEVYVNGAPAASDGSISAGDLIRTGGTGSATLTLNEKASFRIFPNSEIVFSGKPQYVAELKLGKVLMNSTGTTDINLRAGSSVVVPLAEGQQSSSEIEAPSDGSFLVTCDGGSVGVVPLQGGKGIFIQSGQSVSISAQGELSALDARAASSAISATAVSTQAEAEPTARRKHGMRRWILIGAAAAGAGVAAAILTANGSSGASSVTSISAANPAPPSVAAPSNGPSPAPPPSDPGSPAPPSAGQGSQSGNQGNGGGDGDEGSGNQGSAPGHPAPAPPPPGQPAPAPPPGHNCNDHHHKNCSPHVVIGFAFRF